jgi:hypothetical protein
MNDGESGSVDYPLEKHSYLYVETTALFAWPAIKINCFNANVTAKTLAPCLPHLTDRRQLCNFNDIIVM